MKIRAKSDDPIQDLRNNPNNEVTRLQGTRKARLLLLTPPVTDVDVDQNLCWSGPTAEIFFQLLQAAAPLTPSEFLVIPSAFRRQTTKNFKLGDGEQSRGLLSKLHVEPQVKGAVCIGLTAFKNFFGHGRAPSMGVLSSGQTLRVAELSHKPLLVFPDLELLCITKETVQGSYREKAQALAAKRQLLALIESKRLMQKVYDLWAQ